MITSNMARVGHPSRIKIELNSPEGRHSGLRTDSVIMTDNLATLLDTEFDRTIGVLNDLTSVDKALRHTLGL